MAKVYESIEPRLAQWMEQQPVFFMATAPLSVDGLVNVSPKGLHGTGRGVTYTDACGYTVPQMDLRGERDLLDSWTERKTLGELDDYRARRNVVSLDGLPGLW